MGSNVDEITCSSWERIGSKGQVVEQLTQITLEDSLSVRGEREEKSGMSVGGSWAVGKWYRELVAGGCHLIGVIAGKDISSQRRSGKRCRETVKRSNCCEEFPSVWVLLILFWQ